MAPPCARVARVKGEHEWGREEQKRAEGESTNRGEKNRRRQRKETRREKRERGTEESR